MPEGYRKFRLKTSISGTMLAAQLNTQGRLKQGRLKQGRLSSKKGTILTKWLDEKLGRMPLYRSDNKPLSFCVGLNCKESN